MERAARRGRRDIVRVGRWLYERRLNNSLDGNVSVRLDGRRILVTPTGVRKCELRTDEVVEVDLLSRTRRGRCAPTSELAMHVMIYLARPDVEAVVHAHPPYCSAFAVSADVFDGHILAEAIATVGRIGSVGYLRPGSEALAKEVGDRIVASDALILANHGALTVGRDLWEAFHRIEVFEHGAMTCIESLVLVDLAHGGPVPNDT